METVTLSRARYEDIVQRAYTLEHPRAAEEVQKGIRQVKELTPLFGYFPPRWMLDFGATCAFLYARTGQAAFAEQARDALMFYREWQYHLPPGAARQRPEYIDGIAPIEPVFYPSVFVPAVCNIRDALTASELECLVELLADTLRSISFFPEWGGHNRAMLRAAGLAAAAHAFPHHAEAAHWEALADELAEESWGRWSIEDAMLYQPHWLRSQILYAVSRGREAALRDQIQPHMHLKAMTQLISPLGILPDFGDSHWLMHSHWEWAACLEWGASAYRDPAMKWTANHIMARCLEDQPSAYLATVAALAWNWCDESIPAHEPLNRDDALDDVVMKKKVWRTGWDAQDSYACLNYRDEGDFGRVARDYLRTTLAVSAEKMHHGHADEGSFSMLVHDGTLLLHESGYREQPPDGIYRSAVYHNRLVWQTGRLPEGQELLPWLRQDGRYLPVRTERLYQTQLDNTEFTRIRTTDETHKIVWDRSILFLPDLPGWIVLDAATATQPGFRTISSLWWTTDLLARGTDWFETHIHGVMDWQNRKEATLLVCLPPVPGQSGKVEAIPFRRHFQEEIALAHTWSGELRPGAWVNFVSILWPHRYEELDETRPQAIEGLASQPYGRGVGVRLRWKGEERLYGTLNDLTASFGSEDIRPTYSAERGMTTYSPVSSDAALVSLRTGPGGKTAGFINGTRYVWNGEVLYQAPPCGMFQENRTASPGVAARFRWCSRSE